MGLYIFFHALRTKHIGRWRSVHGWFLSYLWKGNTGSGERPSDTQTVGSWLLQRVGWTGAVAGTTSRLWTCTYRGGRSRVLLKIPAAGRLVKAGGRLATYLVTCWTLKTVCVSSPKRNLLMVPKPRQITSSDQWRGRRWSKVVTLLMKSF